MFMRNRREFDVKLEKISNSMLRSSSYDRCYGDSSYAATSPPQKTESQLEEGMNVIQLKGKNEKEEMKEKQKGN